MPEVTAFWTERTGAGSLRTEPLRPPAEGEVLVRTLGWPAVERVWLPAWLSTPGAVLDRLEEVARAARTGSSSGAARARVTGPRSHDFARSEPGRIARRPS